METDKLSIKRLLRLNTGKIKISPYRRNRLYLYSIPRKTRSKNKRFNTPEGSLYKFVSLACTTWTVGGR